LNRLANARIDRAAAFFARVLHFHLIGWHLAIASARQSNEHDPIGYRPDEPSFVAAIFNSTLMHFPIPLMIENRHRQWLAKHSDDKFHRRPLTAIVPGRREWWSVWDREPDLSLLPDSGDQIPQ
jgi:hypothetical protein